MAKWKLCRQIFGTETFSFTEGDEVTLGRGLNNTITLTSLVISRAHCVINARSDELYITDLNSSNGVYVGTKRIPPNIPYVIKDTDVIGIGWTSGVALNKIQDSEKFIFKVVQEHPAPLISRITFQSDDEFENIERKIASLDTTIPEIECDPQIKPTLKRKMSFESNSTNKVPDKIIKTEIQEVCNNDVISILSDSDTEANKRPIQNFDLNIKLESVPEEPAIQPTDKNGLHIKNEYLEYEAFNVKQEYMGYDDELIAIDSDSDSESEHWYMRLSQSSPGKPFTLLRDKSGDVKPEDSSYSQMDDDLGCNTFGGDDSNYLEDQGIIEPPKEPEPKRQPPGIEISFQVTDVPIVDNQKDENDDIIKGTTDKIKSPQLLSPSREKGTDEVDGFSSKEAQVSTTIVAELDTSIVKRAQMIQPLNQMPRKKTQVAPEKKSRRSSTKNDKKSKSSSKKHNVSLSSSQKEERKRKLKEIAQKAKVGSSKSSKDETDINASEHKELPSVNLNTSKLVSNVKVTSTNRQTFLTESIKPVKETLRTSTKEKKQSSSPKVDSTVKSPDQSDNVENTNKSRKTRTEHQKSKIDLNNSKSTSKNSKSQISSNNSNSSESREPLKTLRPSIISTNCKVDQQPQKKKKSVQFSEEKPEIHYFEIEDGNKMKKTSLVKTSLLDNRQMPIFSLEKITLMKILRWNPHWLEEQINNNEPPPILGHNNPPMAIFHSFTSHNQYVQLIGDLLLMEIWECLSIGYTKIRGQNVGLKMSIASLPPVPTQERHFEIFNFSVDVSLPSSEIRSLPRMGEILLASFGPENSRHQRFFFVNNVRTLPSPPSNRNSFYNISLHAIFSDKMRMLRPGEVITGISLAYIHKELSLFEAMAYMAGSPLSEAILRPEPRHFIRELNPNISMTSQWTTTLNPSQQVAVATSVSAALGDQPCIQMVQGPPGTGKSSVICSIVMSYFYDANGKKQQNRGKILICATSNAAVDELVIRLLNIRQSLPTAERFRMVRVGRAEAMHPRARDVSSQQLAQRDAARQLHEPHHQRPGLAEEIAHIEAKINMWKTAAQDAAAKGQDPMRVAYCQGRIADLVKRIGLLRGGGGGGDELRPEQLTAAERRIIEGADIVVTTLASAHNNKMKGLKRRIALCIVDEAGQAIEPEALIPLTLDVTKLTLIGDPQQLPGYICSQRAKKHGLGESLFSRLASAATTPGGGGGVLLLREQYRMHAAIAEYPNRAFYAGHVRSAAPARAPLPAALPPYAILAVPSGDRGQSPSGANETEAWGVSRLVVALVAALKGENLSLAVITPYNAHKELIKKYLKILMDPAEGPVEVNTVDSFQGQERDVTVVSLARSSGVGFLTDAGRMNVMLTRARRALLVCLNPHAVLGQERDVTVVSLARSSGVGFLTDAGRMNVMLTRARRALLVCLNPHAVLKHPQWRTLVEDAQRRKLFRTLPYKMCGATSQVPNEEIIRYITK